MICIRCALAGALLSMGVVAPAWAQDQAPNVAYPDATSAPPIAAGTAAPSAAVRLKRGTQVDLMAVREVNSATAYQGLRFELRVHRPVKLGGQIVIPVGTPAWGRVVGVGKDEDDGLLGSPKLAVQLERIDLGRASIPLTGGRLAQGSGTMPTVQSNYLVTTYTLRWDNAKVKAGEVLWGTIAEDVTFDIPVATAPKPMQLVRPAPAGKRGKKTGEGPFVLVNPDVGVPVFPYDFPDVPYTVVAEIEVGVREATSYSDEPSQTKIYRELWERAAKKGADAVINARYDDPHMSVLSLSARKTDATGTAIRFNIPAAESAPDSADARRQGQ